MNDALLARGLERLGDLPANGDPNRAHAFAVFFCDFDDLCLKRWRDDIALYCTVIVALFVTACAVALIDTAVAALTRFVFTTKLPVVAPCGSTIPGTAGEATVAFVLVTETGSPPAGAAHSLVTTAFTLVPPTTVDGESTSDVR